MGAQDAGQGSVRLVRAGERFTTTTDWLQSAHSFSFGPHYDPDNIGFGPLMVFNHERLITGSGFDDHPHANAEIVTWMLAGSLAHADSNGRRGIVHRGRIQRMSAGRGIVHAERNDAYTLDATVPRRPAEYVQMWVRPDEADLEPSYADAGYAEADLTADWVPVASGRPGADPLVTLHAAATLWVTRLAAGTVRPIPEAPRLHLYVAHGRCRLEEAGELAAGDAARLVGAGPRRVTALADAELLAWDLDA